MTEHAHGSAADERPEQADVKLTVYLAPALRQAAKVRAAQDGITMSALLGRLLERHLASEAAE